MFVNIGIGLAAVIVVVALTWLALPRILRLLGWHPDYEGAREYQLPGRKALVITTSHGVLSKPGETTGKAVGVMPSEFTIAYYQFLDAGMEVDISSIMGGYIPFEPPALSRVIRSSACERMLADPALLNKTKSSLKVDDVDFTQYDVIWMAGGWGAAYDMGFSEVLGRKLGEAYYGDKRTVFGSVCHGALGLIRARNRDGELLISGRRVTGVSDRQIRQLGIDFTPQHPEKELRKAGGLYEKQEKLLDFFATHTVVDDEKRFVTGQNQNSSHETAQKIMAILDERSQAAQETNV